VSVYAYLRVSTSEQAATGHGLDAQRESIRQVTERRGWKDVEWHVDGGHSGKDLDRPAMREVLSKIRKGDVLVVAKLDRLSRSLADFAGLMQQASRRGWSFVALDLGVDTTTPTGRLVANVMASVSEWEREVIGQRTKEGMAAARAKGRLPGKRSSLDPSTRVRILAERSAGASLRAIASGLTSDGVPTATCRAGWTASQVHQAIRSATLEAEIEASQQLMGRADLAR